MSIDPITRKERILAGQDITPLRRDEYFLKNSATGGSSLPEYTSSDIGKVLTVGVGSELGSYRTIIDESVTFTQSGPYYIGQIADPSALFEIEEGESVRLSVGDKTIVGEVIVDGGEYGVFDEELNVGISWEQYEAYVTAPEAGTFNVKVDVRSKVPTPKWEPPYLLLKATGYIQTENSTYIYALDHSYAELQAAFNINSIKPVYVAVPKFINHRIDYSDPYVLLVNVAKNDGYQAVVDTNFYDEVEAVWVGMYQDNFALAVTYEQAA